MYSILFGLMLSVYKNKFSLFKFLGFGYLTIDLILISCWYFLKEDWHCKFKTFFYKNKIEYGNSKTVTLVLKKSRVLKNSPT